MTGKGVGGRVTSVDDSPGPPRPDLPQVVDVLVNPRGRDLLARDAATVCEWFTARGLPGAGPDELTTILLADAGLC